MSLDFIQLFNQKVQNSYLKRTGISVDIQNIGRNKELIAVKEKETYQELRPGVWFAKKVINFPDGNFTNVYDLSWNPNQIGIKPEIHSSSKPYTLYEFVRKNKSIIAAINGSFFFLTDIADAKPYDLPYDFCVRNSEVIGLPASDEPILYIKNDKIHTKEIKATGTILVGKKLLRWVGAQSSLSKYKRTILYNSKCATIKKIRERKTGVQIGILDNVTIRTPKGIDHVDLIIKKSNNGSFYIDQIIKGGGTHFFAGIFILQLRNKRHSFTKGSIVDPITLDKIDLQNISSGITIGQRVSNKIDPSIDIYTKRDARSIIAQDRLGHIHFTVYDGSKYVPGFNGVFAPDIGKIYSKKAYVWAYYLDGGGSTRLIVRNKKRLGIYANLFAFRKVVDGLFLWDWRRARRIASSISLLAVNN